MLNKTVASISSPGGGCFALGAFEHSSLTTLLPKTLENRNTSSQTAASHKAESSHTAASHKAES